MRRLVFIIPFLILVSLLCFSQSWCLGIKGGVPMTWASGDDWDDYVDIYNDQENEFEPGIFFGAFLSYDFTERIGMQLEGLYGIYQWGFSGEYAGDNYLAEYRLDMLEVPLMFKFMNKLGPGKLTLLAGPFMQYITGNIDADGEKNGKEIEQDPANLPDGEVDNINVYGITAGIGYDLPIKSWQLSFETRYNRQLTSLFDKKTSRENHLFPPDFDGFYINAVEFYLSLGYRFGKK